jgi:hypothetical protein
LILVKCAGKVPAIGSIHGYLTVEDEEHLVPLCPFLDD